MLGKFAFFDNFIECLEQSSAERCRSLVKCFGTEKRFGQVVNNFRHEHERLPQCRKNFQHFAGCAERGRSPTSRSTGSRVFRDGPPLRQSRMLRETVARRGDVSRLRPPTIATSIRLSDVAFTTDHWFSRNYLGSLSIMAVIINSFWRCCIFEVRAGFAL